MPRGPLTFKKRDVTRALLATAEAGFDVARAEIDSEGKIVVICNDKSKKMSPKERNPWHDI
jgi:hypothetical protein